MKKPEKIQTDADYQRAAEEAGDRYRQSVITVVLASRALVDLDLPAILESIERAHVIGPFMDPTLYRDKMDAMNEDRDLLTAALPLWRWAQTVKAAAAAEKGVSKT